MKFFKSIYIVITMLVMSAGTFSSAFAQGTVLSPYSKYGYGMLSDGATSAQRAMGGVGYAMAGGRQINVMNPASYASIDSLTFLWDIGASMVNYWAQDGDNHAKKTGGGLDYFTMQFPIGKRFGASVGLLPYSSVGYAFGSTITNGSSQSSGSGGINQLYAGFSAKIFKGFNLGVNVGYLWGSIINDNYGYASTGGISLFERVMEVKDYSLNFGAQYTFAIKKKHELTLGATFAPEKELHGNESGIYYDVSSETVPDTAAMNKLNGNYSIPYSLGAGIAYTYDKRLNVEVDYTYQPWAKAKYNSAQIFEQTTLADRWKLAAGVQYTHANRGSVFRRMTYRAGVYYSNDYLQIAGNKVKEFGASIGFGIPTRRSEYVSGKTIVNIGFEYKHRNSSPISLVKEDYFNITIGINFNEMWFWKRRFE